MELQYVCTEGGRRTGVVVPIDTWKDIISLAEEAIKEREVEDSLEERDISLGLEADVKRKIEALREEREDLTKSLERRSRAKEELGALERRRIERMIAKGTREDLFCSLTFDSLLEDCLAGDTVSNACWRVKKVPERLERR